MSYTSNNDYFIQNGELSVDKPEPKLATVTELNSDSTQITSTSVPTQAAVANATKPGIKSSELWITVSALIGYAVAIFYDVNIQQELGDIGALIPGVVAMVYAVARVVMKVKLAQPR